MTSRFDLSGKAAIVTAGGTGIGRGLALGLADHGASVVIADIAGERAETVAAEAEARGACALPMTIDVCNPDDVDRLVDATLQQFGGVDILVNNAGGGRRGASTAELAIEDWRFTMDLTVTSAFLCSQRAGRVMIRQGRGKIINIGSVYGLIGHNPALYDPRPDGQPPETLAYAAAKGAVISMTRALAVYWAPHNINVNAIAPGPVKTERLTTGISAETWARLATHTPLQRPAVPEDMAGAAIFLASSASDYMTGQILVVDGGWTIW